MTTTSKLLSLAAALGLAAASPSQAQNREPQRPGADDARTLATAISGFAVRMLQSDALPAGDLCYSPASAALALLMSFAGAHGETAAEMAAALAPAGWEQARVHAAAAALQKRLQRDDPAFTLGCVQDAWIQDGHPVQDAYRDLLDARYGATPRRLDFLGHVEDARVAINRRIAEATRDRIPELLQPGDVTPSTRFVLTNALYLKADWADPFDPEDTRGRPFALDGGESVRVQTMHRMGDYRVSDIGGITVVRLPYRGGDFAMDIALPTEGDDAPSLDAVLSRLVAPAAADWTAGLKEERIALALPRFRLENRMVLNPALQAAGIRRAFGPEADFRGIDGNPAFFAIELVLQQTWLQVGEEGTEAAAATAVIKRAGSAVRQPRSIRFDRPFAFALRDLETGLVTFAGRVCDPRGREARR